MNKATYIAMTPSLKRTLRLQSVRTVVVGVLSAFVLAACGGGAQTTENPVAQNNGGGGTTIISYNGINPARDADVLRFQTTLWSDVVNQATCANCHNETTGQVPMWVRGDDINMAYDAALTVVDLQQPNQSRIVEKVGQGHHCWSPDVSVCTALMTRWIENWAGDIAGGGRTISLTPPAMQPPGDSKNFPTDPALFQQFVYTPYLDQYCSGCHSQESASAVQPYHSDTDVGVAYEAAKPKIDLDDPLRSRLVQRLLESHHCWTQSCTADAALMQAGIANMAGQIQTTSVDPNLVTSGALTLLDGTIASGGNRYENSQVALWEFKTGIDRVAYDTSGVAPSIDLTLSDEVTWYGGWGITMNGGKAQASTTASRKLNDFIQASGGQFSIEAWVIPANVTQEEARIVSYSNGPTTRNFTLQQTLYNYDFQLRTTETGANGDPALSTPAMDEVLQATLQHVVATYDPINGRQIYVNGLMATNIDPVLGGTIGDWENTYAMVLGNETSGDSPFEGTFRLVAVHNAVLTQPQVQQNFDVGVGEKFYLLFDISAQLAAAPQSSYILFEAQQFDSYAYLFDAPHFLTLDGSAPQGIDLEGMRIGMNGLEAQVGQTYATMDTVLDATQFQELGQRLSTLGAVLPLVKGADSDEFFLTFDNLNGITYSRQAAPMLVITPSDLPPASHIGLRTFDEINATFAAVTGVDPTTTAVDMTFQELRQSLPAVADINSFLSSHQVAIAQLAIQYCDAMIGTQANPGPNLGTYFPGFDFNNQSSFATNRDAYVTPLINRIMGTGVVSNPTFATVQTELATFTASGNRPNNLVDRLDANSNTRDASKGVCAAMLGSAITLVQ